MASLTITIPDEQVDRVREAFGGNNLGYPPGETPPLMATPAQIKEAIVRFIKHRTIEYEREKARIAAYSALPVDVDIT